MYEEGEFFFTGVRHAGGKSVRRRDVWWKSAAVLWLFGVCTVMMIDRWNVNFGVVRWRVI